VTIAARTEREVRIFRFGAAPFAFNIIPQKRRRFHERYPLTVHRWLADSLAKGRHIS
jgi:hypothetical protein